MIPSSTSRLSSPCVIDVRVNLDRRRVTVQPTSCDGEVGKRQRLAKIIVEGYGREKIEGNIGVACGQDKGAVSGGVATADDGSRLGITRRGRNAKKIVDLIIYFRNDRPIQLIREPELGRARRKVRRLISW